MPPDARPGHTEFSKLHTRLHNSFVGLTGVQPTINAVDTTLLKHGQR